MSEDGKALCAGGDSEKGATSNQVVASILKRWWARLEVLVANIDEVDDEIGEVQDEMMEVYCTLTGDHEWIYDQCGLWEHQYCVHCRKAKYPDLAGKSCRELEPRTEEPENWEARND